ncbi:MAG TPA: DUF6655 family protein [Planctomycetaceae bacterium]|nr:DUF6655 family protein [Planctomycetaceae bacterium]
MMQSLTSLPSNPPLPPPLSPIAEDVKRGDRRPSSWLGIVAALSLAALGCGRIVSQKATDQLIAGDAVDRTVSQIDFRILMGKKCFLDTQYINKTIPGVGFVTSEYMISSVRQKMMCDGCLLQEKAEEADFVVEMRIGALGADGNEVIYGVPANNFVSLAASVVPTSPQAAAALPSMPELSFGKKDDQMAAAKIALFAYNRRTRDPIWQSGLSESRSLVADRWFFGAGPFHKGNIYVTKKQQQTDPPLFGAMEDDEPSKQDYFVERRFADPSKSLADNPPAAKPAVATAPPAAGTAPAVAAATPAANTTPVAATTPAAAVAAASAATAPAAAVAPAAGTNLAKTTTVAPDPNKAATVAPAPAPATASPPATKTTAAPTATTPVAGPAMPLSGPAAGAPQTVSSASP